MASKRRAKRSGARQSQPAANVRDAPMWKWRALPVWLALTGGFMAGWYVAALGVGAFPGNWAYFVFLAVVVGFSFGLSRITSQLMVRWRLRRMKQTTPPAASGRQSKGPHAPA